MSAVKTLLPFLKPYKRWAILAPLLMVIEVGMDLMQPRLIERIVDQGIAALNMAVVIHTGLLMAGLAVVGAVGGAGCTVYAVKAAFRFGADVRDALFRQVQSLSFRNLDELETGHLITCLTNDVTQVQEAFFAMIRVLVRTPLLMVGSFIMALITAPGLAFLLVILIPVVLVGILFIINKTFPLFSIVQEKLDNLNTVMQENLAGVRVVKAFVRADHEMKRFGGVNDELMNKTIRVVKISSVMLPYMLMSVNLGVVGALWFGGIQVSSGNLQTGQIIAFINYLLSSLISLLMVSMIIMQISRAQASARRIEEVLKSTPAIRENSKPFQAAKPAGRISFENVTFSYDGNDREPVLRDISFVAEPGQTVALLGATGSGKSTLANLIPRFYDVTQGRVTLDGVDVKDYDTDSLRRSVGFALQETVLFSGTIRDNIRYAKPDAADDQVIEAAKIAQAHDFILQMPQGYDTMLGQRGVNLSGGQKQRVAIARAVLAKPPVLILDDSTSSVDVETETRIQDALETVMQHSTNLVIAQRISTVLNADMILVLDKGRIAAEGTHTELLGTNPIYTEIYDSQLGNGNGRRMHG